MIVSLLKIELLSEAEKIDTTEFYNGKLIIPAQRSYAHSISAAENDMYCCAQ
jgi:hypothetical protein